MSKDKRPTLQTRGSKQSNFMIEQKPPSPRIVRVNNFISEPKVICQQLPKTIKKQSEFTQTLQAITLQPAIMQSQDMKSKSYLAEASVLKATPRNAEPEVQVNKLIAASVPVLKVEVNNADYVKLMSAYETLKRVDETTKMAETLADQASLLKTAKLTSEEQTEGFCDEKERQLITLFELITSKNENYAVILKSLLKDGDQASVLRSIDGFVKSFADELTKTTANKTKETEHKWTNIEREIELQEDLNNQLQLQIDRIAGTVQLLEQESGSEEKIAELVKERENLTEQLAEVQKTKQNLQQSQQAAVQTLAESKDQTDVSNAEFDANFVQNSIAEACGWLNNTPTLIDHLESKYQQLLRQKMPSVSEFEVSSSQQAKEQHTADRLSKLMSMYHSRQTEVTRLEAELRQLEIEETDAEELNKVLQTLSFKHIRKNV